MIKFCTLGTLDLLDRSDGHQILSVLAQPKRVGFLTYVAVASPRGLHQRDTLLGIFWPDSTDKKARNALNQTVFVLRRALGQQFFIMNGEPGVGVDPEQLWCDVWEFEASLASGEKEEALDLYQGNFLEGFFLPGCLDFERWVDFERSRLRDLATGAVLSLSREMESAGNPVGAVGWLRRAREWAVYDEQVLSRLVELLLALGDRSGAVREYESFARRLSVDLGLEPSETAQKLLRRPTHGVGAWHGAGTPGETTEDPQSPPCRPKSTGGRRFSLPQTVGIACLAGVVGAGAVLSVPGLRTGATSGVDPVPIQIVANKNVVVLPLDNATGDPSLDPLGVTAADKIVQELAASGLASVRPAAPPSEAPGASEGRVAPPGEAGPHMWALKDAGYVVTGSFYDQNGGLAYQVRIIEAESGKIAVAVDTVMGSMADPSSATERLKRRVSGALAMVLDSRLSGLTNVASHPPSFEAYQLVADGLDLQARALRSGIENIGPGLKAATDVFQKAAALDSSFTLPLILTLEAAGSQAYQYSSQLQILQARRDELPRWERAMLDYFLAWNASDFTGAYEAMRGVVDCSPTPDWRLRLAVLAGFANRPREALDLLTALESEGDFVWDQPDYWSARIDVKLSLGEYEAALGDIERARALDGEYIALIPQEVEALARMGRAEEAVDRSLQYLESTGSPAVHDLWIWLPQVLRGTGLAEQAQYVAERSVASLRGMEESRWGVLPRALVLAGRYEEARQEIGPVGDVESNPYIVYSLLAYMEAREGNAAEAIRLSDMARTVSEAAGPTSARWGVMSQVEVAAQLGDHGRAVRLLRVAFRQGVPGGSWALTRWDLTPLYGYEPFEDLIRPKG